MDKNDLKIVFMGTPEFAVGTLSALVEGDYNVVAVVTQPDKPVGRHGSVLRPSAVKEYALAHDIPLLQPVKMKDPDFVEQLSSFQADLQVVVAFRMLPEVVWAMPRFGTFNVHAALLPQYRGAAPINWAIINGETTTGVTTFFLDHDIDTGRIILQKNFDIPIDANVEYVYNGLMALGADIAIETIDLIISHNGLINSISQEEVVNQDIELHNAPKLFKENCEINWNDTAKNIYNFIRGLSPIPTAWTTLFSCQEGAKMVTADSINDGKDHTLKIYSSKLTSSPSSALPGTVMVEKGRLYVAATDEWLELIDVQAAGKKRMRARDFLNGWR